MANELDRDQACQAEARPPVAAGCGDLGLRIGRDGTWFYRGSAIRRPGLVRLFASVLRRMDDGTYWLVTPGERGPIAVDDVPFVAVELRHAGDRRSQTLDLRTNLDEWVAVGPEHPLRLGRIGGADVPYVLVRPGLEARLDRATYYHLVELAVEEASEEARGPGVWSRGRFFPLQTTTA